MPASKPRTPDFSLSDADIRAVASFAYACAADVIGCFDAVSDAPEPRAALEAAAVVAGGAPRSKLQRIAGPAAHRAAKTVTDIAGYHAAMSAGDAAASVYLHPLADPLQTGHILRAAAHAVLALEARSPDPLPHDQALDSAVRHATPQLTDVLRRYPAAPDGRGVVGLVMRELDERLRAL